MDRILLPGLHPGVVEPVAMPVWERIVVFLDASEHFPVQLLLERLRVGEHFVGVGVLGFQVGRYFRCPLLAKPGVVVDALVAMERRCPRNPGGHWGCSHWSESNCRALFSRDRRPTLR